MAFVSLIGPVITFHPLKWLNLFLLLVAGTVTGEEYILFCFIFRYKIRAFKSQPKLIINFSVKQVHFYAFLQHLTQQDSGR